MSRILIAYATGEGQTGRIAGALANQLEGLGHTVQLAHLTGAGAGPDPGAYDAVLLAASVHAGQHQKGARRYVRRHRQALAGRPAAFLSVSLLAAATQPAGRQRGRGQVQAFLDRTGWHPPLADMAGGAFRASQLSWFLRVGTRLMQKLAARSLRELGWPADLTQDREFTDWDAVRRFGECFAAALPDAPEAARGEVARPA